LIKKAYMTTNLHVECIEVIISIPEQIKKEYQSNEVKKNNSK